MSELALKLIAENKKTRATFLDLGRCGLTEVPDEIGELVWLEGLSFAGEWWDGKQRYKSQNTEEQNNITRLSHSFKKLNQLKNLWLNGDNGEEFDLSDLSPLADISGLQKLNVSYTNVSDLKPLATLRYLQELNASSTKVTDLSPLVNLNRLLVLDVRGTAVADLRPLVNLNRLIVLYIEGTVVADLSPLSALSNLSMLSVGGTKITNLCPLANLDRLSYFDVSSTAVSNLSSLAGLNNLRWLNLSDTAISDLNSLANLTELQTLYVSQTKLSDLKPLSKLINLQVLHVSKTLITDLSPLAALSSLQRLNVSNTKIADLSPLLPLIKSDLAVKWSLDTFREGNGIYVKDCPLTNPPVAIVQQGNDAILNYFKETQQQGTNHLYEAKLLIVGAGGAGKTSLIRRLYQTTKPLPEEHETTKGIDVYQHKFTVQDSRYPNGCEFRLNVWDFAGQEQYRPADTFFFTQRSLYVLLDDTRNDDKTVQDACFKYWLEAVDCFSDNSPVLIFQNEKGGRSKAIDLAGIKAKFENVKERYSGNLEHKNAADKVRDAIEFYAKHLPHIGEALPAKWINIRAEIEQAAKQQATISQQDYFKLYEKHLPFDREKALHLSQYLHDLGVFLHFQKDNLLKRVVILQNQWATEAVFKILDDETVKIQHGRFTEEDCQRLWQDSDYADMHPELLALMEKFELCYLLQDSTPKKWLAPQLLPPSKPTELNDWAKAGDLVLRYRYEFLPKGMINRLMVRKHRFVLRPDLGWLTGVLFERDDTQVLVELSSKGDEIVLRARGLERKDLLGIIAAELNAMNASFTGLSDKVTQWIPCCCPQCKTREQPESFERKKLLDKLKQGRQITYCPDSDEKVSVMELLDGVQTKNKEDNMKKIFISYSKHDKRHKNNLIKQLTGLRGKVITWNDADLLAGEDWDERITEELQQADIVLYLVSANSMATEYIQKVELPLIQERCERDECRLVPIIVDFCHWTALDFAKKNALPNKGTPVTDSAWKNQNQAWMTVIQQLEKIV